MGRGFFRREIGGVTIIGRERWRLTDQGVESHVLAYADRACKTGLILSLHNCLCANAMGDNDFSY